jgi:hypothetical protein
MPPKILDWVVRNMPSLWPVVTLLIGIYVGGKVTSRNQRQYWILDNKRAEYRRLISVLTSAASKMILFEDARSGGYEARELKKMQEVARRSANVIYSRLFIAKEVLKLDILARWKKSTMALRQDRNIAAFVKEFDSLIDDIKTEALRNFGQG